MISLYRSAATVFALFAIAACTVAALASSQAQAPPDPMHVRPEAPGWNAAALDEVLTYAQAQKSTGFVIIDRERIIAERYWPLPDSAAQFKAGFVHGTSSDGALLEDVASAQKSFIAILAGIAADKGLLDISRPVLSYIGAGWSKATPEQEQAITVRHLLEMSSGLKENFAFDAPAGTKFFYNTPVYAAMKQVLEKASKKSLDTITLDWLTAPAGMKDTSWRQRPGGFEAAGNPTGLVTTPRDLARMGQLILDTGKSADGRRVISETQLKSLFQRSANNPAYGKLWWLNGGDYAIAPGANAPRSEGSLIKSAPADLVAALGALDRKLYVVPSRRMIVVRMGQAADRDFNQQLWTRLMKAAPPK
jgi:CubicO group peptidase (beta-lactamase class C family)